MDRLRERLSHGRTSVLCSLHNSPVQRRPDGSRLQRGGVMCAGSSSAPLEELRLRAAPPAEPPSPAGLAPRGAANRGPAGRPTEGCLIAAVDRLG
ncbi:unnamed protein product [Arctogadus glacialis]